MAMLVLSLVTTAAATLQAPPAAPPQAAQARVTAFVQIIQAAEVRGGQSDAPHQRRSRLDALGRPETLLEFE